jgi:hypothetical protein
MLIRCLKLGAIATLLMKEDLPRTSPAWQLARQVARLTTAKSPSRLLEQLDAQWTDAAAGAEVGGLTRYVPASAYLMAMFKALRCEDGLILERGAYWIGIARAWSDGRPPAKETDEPKAYEDLEREFDALWQLHAGEQFASERALPDWVTPRQGAQPPLQLAPGSACADIAMAAVAADARNRDSRPVEKGPGQ